MPNWCSTSITFSGNQKDIEKLYTPIAKVCEGKEFKDVKKEAGRIDNFLGDILVAADFAHFEKDTYGGTDVRMNNKEEAYALSECRGGIIDYSIDIKNGEGTIRVDQEDAWSPKLSVWDYLINKWNLDVKYVYTAIEPGNCLFETTDPINKDKYYVEIVGAGFEDDIYEFLSKEGTVETLQEVVYSKSSDLDELIKLARKMEEDGDLDYFTIQKFDFMDSEKIEEKEMFAKACEKLCEKIINGESN